ncbi:hypothetical protein [uncultured Tateyamaria sp.]|uniref:hypothetical protein n=1 Tax=Tateyamaria sp. 1078 TaxID=3417464 RepID=UPI00260D70E5|nr:hypothetical protein [uncultured Tateyamaria sp.]
MRAPITLATLFAVTVPHAASAEGTSPAPLPVAEIVTFRLVEGTDPAAFVAAAKAMGPFLRGTGAFVRRTLSVDNDGLWTDHILWSSQDTAIAASNAMFEQPEARPFMAMIAQDGLVMRYAPVQMQQE